MKRFSLYFIVFLCLQSCEDVVDVKLDTEDPRLVIEATGIQKGQNPVGQFQVILSKTAPYFNDSIPKVSEAEVSLKINNKVISIPESAQNPGIYRHPVPMIYGELYQLTIKAEGEVYRGETKLYSSVPIDTVQQEEGIFDTDQTLLKAFYTDPESEGNYYLFTWLSKHGKHLTLSDDEFYNGNQVSTLFNEEFDPGDSVTIQISGTGKDFNRYLSILIEQGNSGNPFATAPATVRGNMVNLNHPDDFPLGYFRMNQRYQTVYAVEEKD